LVVLLMLYFTCTAASGPVAVAVLQRAPTRGSETRTRPYKTQVLVLLPIAALACVNYQLHRHYRCGYTSRTRYPPHRLL
jgi:hypothetical protein